MSYAGWRTRVAESEARVSDALSAMTEYLESGGAASGNEYLDLRAERNNALDRLDYNTAELHREHARIMARHLTIAAGDKITLVDGRSGVVKSRGTRAGWFVPSTDADSEARFEAVEVLAVERQA